MTFSESKGCIIRLFLIETLMLRIKGQGGLTTKLRHNIMITTTH